METKAIKPYKSSPKMMLLVELNHGIGEWWIHRERVGGPNLEIHPFLCCGWILPRMCPALY